MATPTTAAPNRAVAEIRARKLSQAQLGRIAQVSKQAAGQWLRGRSKPNADVRDRLRAALGVDPEWWDLVPVRVEAPPVEQQPPISGPAAPPNLGPPAPPPPPAGYAPPDEASAWRAPHVQPYDAPDFDRPDIARAEVQAQCARYHQAIHEARHPSDPGRPPADATTIGKLETEYRKALIDLGKFNGEISPIQESTLAKSATYQRSVGALIEILRSKAPHVVEEVAAAFRLAQIDGNPDQS